MYKDIYNAVVSSRAERNHISVRRTWLTRPLYVTTPLKHQAMEIKEKYRYKLLIWLLDLGAKG